MIRVYFDKYGYKVEMVYPGEGALVYLKDKYNEFDLIILDLHMHGICGIEAYKQIRLFSGILILVLTSCNKDIQTILALKIGTDDYMMIPITIGIYQTLNYFVENPQIIMSREVLMSVIQNKTLESFDKSVDIQISRLRKRI